jgi:heterodisulfide reductase subunit A-like polyferredoxin/coenzyme F420-reducing hydrogenase delta subunit
VIQKVEQTSSDVGVVLCDCGGTLRNRLDFDLLQKRLEHLPAVAKVKTCLRFCQQDECTRTLESLFQNKKQVKRLVIGACDRQIFNTALCQTMRSSTVNQGLVWCVNIREHCGWVTSTPEAATDKGIEALTAAIRRIRLASAIKSKKVRMNQSVLVVGGGLAAMQTALALSQLGHRVTLVESSEKLGGLAAEIPELYAYVAADSADAEVLVRGRVHELISGVRNDKRIRVQTAASLKSLEGEVGGFTAVVASNGTVQEVSVGAVVLALDSATMKPDIAQLLHNVDKVPKRIAIVTDVLGEQGQVVSAHVLSGAELLTKRFGAEVRLFCHNIRVAATGLESLYRRARQAGVVVVKYESPPTILDKGLKKVVRVKEAAIGYQVDEEFDLVVTADNWAANSNNEVLSLIKVLRPSSNGMLQEDNVWFLPTKTSREGIFVISLAGDKDELRGAQTDGLATAYQIHQLLKNKQIEFVDDAAVVDGDKCVLCLTCMRICPHGAVSIDVNNGVASISAMACQRCGICAAECPAGAIELPRYTQKEITAEVGDKPRIVVFACENSAYPAATAAAINSSEWERGIQLIRVPCVGKVDPRDVLRALERGAEKVIILGCHLENCRYLAGSTRARRRIERLNSELEKAGLDKKRVVFGELASVEPAKFLEHVGTCEI